MKAMVRFFRDFGSGIISCYRATLFVFDKKLWPYFFVSAVVAGICIWLGIYISEDALQYHVPSSAREDVPELTWAVGKWFFQLLLLIMLFKLNKYIVLILLPPVLSRISEKTEEHIAGTTYKFSFMRFWEDIKRSLRIVLNNFLWEAGLLLAFVFLMLIIPQMRPAYPYYSFIIGFYFYGFSMIDYSIERRRMSMEASKKFIRKHMGLAVSIGLVYSALFLLNIDFGWFTEHTVLKNVNVNIGVIFAPIICVVAATMGVHKIVDLSTNPSAIGYQQPDTAESTEDEPETED